MRVIAYIQRLCFLLVTSLSVQVSSAQTFTNPQFPNNPQNFVVDGKSVTGNTPLNVSPNRTVSYNVLIYKSSTSANNGYIELYPGNNTGVIGPTPLSGSRQNVIWGGASGGNNLGNVSGTASLTTAAVTGYTRLYAVFFNTNSSPAFKQATSNGIVLSFPAAPVAPTVTSFSPASGSAGTVVTIIGNNFTGTTNVQFGSYVASFQVNSSTNISATVPSGTGNLSVPIRITTGAGTAVTSNFNIIGTIPCTSDVYLQNRILSGNYSSGNVLYAGRAVTPSAPFGDAIVTSAADFVAREEIVLADGFSVQQQGNTTFSATINTGVCSNAVMEEDPAPDSEQSRSSFLQVDAENRMLAVDNEVEIYPNPANEEMLVRLPEKSVSREVQIYNSYGRKVERLTLQPGYSKVDVSALKPGIYYIHAQVEGKVVKTRFRVAR